MDKAKAAVSNFLSKDGKHETTVHERVNPAVQHENISRTQHESATTAVDREVHQDHHHTSVQPIQHREVLPEKHSHQLGDVEHREINHGSGDHVKQRLAAEAAQFKDQRTVGETQHTASANQAVVGEHVHHHVHETIQPVIQKETIQPSVIHTTVPVHEIHHNEARHHTASALPAVSMDEFKRQGGNLSGRDERTDQFAGEPKAIGSTIGGQGARGRTSLTENESGRVGYANESHGMSGMNRNGLEQNEMGQHTGGQTSGKKPSLLDKLNPKTDSNGDGKPGIMH